MEFSPKFRLPSSEGKIKRFNILLVGDSQVGKTTFHNSYLTGKFQPAGITWTGLDSFHIGAPSQESFYFECSESSDFGCDEKIGRADAVLFFYDIGNRQSFANLSAWFNKVEKCSYQFPQAVFVGTKSSGKREVTEEDKQKLLEETWMQYPIIEVCSESQINMGEPYLTLCKKLMSC
jgi:GTPase SAR1 family protein